MWIAISYLLGEDVWATEGAGSVIGQLCRLEEKGPKRAPEFSPGQLFLTVLIFHGFFHLDY